MREHLEKQKVNITSVERSMIPNSTVPLDAETAIKVLRLADRLEELDDVQKVYFNADIPTEVMETYEG